MFIGDSNEVSFSKGTRSYTLTDWVVYLSQAAAAQGSADFVIGTGELLADVLAGEMKVYVEGEVFAVTAAECMFVPRGKPHAFLVASEELHNIALITPGGLLDAVNRMKSSGRADGGAD